MLEQGLLSAEKIKRQGKTTWCFDMFWDVEHATRLLLDGINCSRFMVINIFDLRTSHCVRSWHRFIHGDRWSVWVRRWYVHAASSRKRNGSDLRRNCITSLNWYNSFAAWPDRGGSWQYSSTWRNCIAVASRNVLLNAYNLGCTRCLPKSKMISG